MTLYRIIFLIPFTDKLLLIKVEDARSPDGGT